MPNRPRLRDPNATTWRCTKCREEKPIGEFRPSAKAKSGLHSQCRGCVSEYARPKARAWAQAHPKRLLARVKEWQKTNPQKVAEYQRGYRSRNPGKTAEQMRAWRSRNGDRDRCNQRSWREANRERARASGRAWRRKNPEKTAESYRRWWKSHPEAVHERYQRRRALAKGAPVVERVRRQEVFARDRWICGLCHRPVKRADASLDHIVPLAVGGEHSYRNVQCAHRRCNSAKGAKIKGQLRLCG